MNEEPLERARSLVRLEIAISVLLVTAAASWAAWKGTGLRRDFSWHWQGVVAGLAVALVLFSLLPLITKPAISRLPLVRDLSRVWDLLVGAVGSGLTPLHVVLLATSSGFSEEIFFRGVLQKEIGLAAASGVFGLLHFVNAAYALWAGVVGALFGIAFEKTGTLVAPVTAHVVYNFLALSYLRHRARAQPKPAR